MNGWRLISSFLSQLEDWLNQTCVDNYQKLIFVSREMKAMDLIAWRKSGLQWLASEEEAEINDGESEVDEC